MARTANSTDFTVDVDNIGRFIFGRRTAGDVFKIRARYSVATEGNYEEDGRVADMGGLAYVTIQTLQVAAPEGFAVEDLDPIMDDDFEKKIMAIFKALRARELSFRPSPPKASESPGDGAGAELRVLVPEEVQPDADGPPLSGNNG
jgi:hypothetical protein